MLREWSKCNTLQQVVDIVVHDVIEFIVENGWIDKHTDSLQYQSCIVITYRCKNVGIVGNWDSRKSLWKSRKWVIKLVITGRCSDAKIHKIRCNFLYIFQDIKREGKDELLCIAHILIPCSCDTMHFITPWIVTTILVHNNIAQRLIIIVRRNEEVQHSSGSGLLCLPFLSEFAIYRLIEKPWERQRDVYKSTNTYRIYKTISSQYFVRYWTNSSTKFERNVSINYNEYYPKIIGKIFWGIHRSSKNLTL